MFLQLLHLDARAITNSAGFYNDIHHSWSVIQKITDSVRKDRGERENIAAVHDFCFYQWVVYIMSK